MPTRPRYKGRKPRPIDFELQKIHLEIGDCLIAVPHKGCACGLRRPDGTEDERAFAAVKRRWASELTHNVDAFARTNDAPHHRRSSRSR